MKVLLYTFVSPTFSIQKSKSEGAIAPLSSSIMLFKVVVNYSVLHRSVRSFSKTIVYSVLHRSERSFSKTIKHTTKRVQSQPIKSFCRLKPVSLDFHLTRNHLNTSENKRSRCPPSPASWSWSWLALPSPLLSRHPESPWNLLQVTQILFSFFRKRSNQLQWHIIARLSSD